MQQAGQRLRVIKLLLVGQFIASIVAGLFAFGLFGHVSGKSAWLGGLICWLPNCYFAFRAFRYRGARAAQKIVRSFYAGEVGKMMLTMLFFALVFIKVKPLDALALFSGYALVMTLSWIVPIFVAREENKRISK